MFSGYRHLTVFSQKGVRAPPSFYKKSLQPNTQVFSRTIVVPPREKGGFFSSTPTTKLLIIFYHNKTYKNRTSFSTASDFLKNSPLSQLGNYSSLFNLNFHKSWPRNFFYLFVLMGVLVLLIITFKFVSKSSAESNFDFDETRITNWPRTQMTAAAVAGLFDPSRVTPRYLHLLAVGCASENATIQSNCMNAAMALCSGTDAFLEKLGNTLPIENIATSVLRDPSVVSTVIPLLESLSCKGTNATKILNEETLPILVSLLKTTTSSKEVSTLALMMANLARSGKVTELLAQMAPSIYDLSTRSSKKDVKQNVLTALKLVHDSAKNKATFASLPVGEFRVTSQEESVFGYHAKATLSAAVLGPVYAIVREAFRGGSPQLGLDFATRVAPRLPMLVGVPVALTILAHLPRAVEPKSKNSRIAYELVGTTYLIGLCWASQGLVPHTFLPTMVYPMYRAFRDNSQHPYTYTP